MEPITSKPTNRSPILWILVVLLVGAATGVGGYFLGKNNAADKVATNTPTTNPQQQMQEFCSQGYCIDYDRTKWQFTDQTKEDTKPIGNVVSLKHATSTIPVEVHFSTFNELGGQCDNCYAYPVQLIAHPNVENFYIIKLLRYTRDDSNAISDVKGGLFVMDKANINLNKLKVGKEHKGLVFSTFYAGNTFPGEGSSPISSWLYYEDSTTHTSLEPAKNILEKESGFGDAYEILTSLRKQAQ